MLVVFSIINPGPDVEEDLFEGAVQLGGEEGMLAVPPGEGVQHRVLGHHGAKVARTLDTQHASLVVSFILKREQYKNFM